MINIPWIDINDQPESSVDIYPASYYFNEEHENTAREKATAENNDQMFDKVSDYNLIDFGMK